jgi:serine/threonine protein kinase
MVTTSPRKSPSVVKASPRKSPSAVKASPRKSPSAVKAFLKPNVRKKTLLICLRGFFKNRYRVQKQIGYSRAYGFIFKGVKVSDNTKVLIEHHYLEEEPVPQRREFLITTIRKKLDQVAKIKSPYIAKLVETDYHGHDIYIVSEANNETSLRDLLDTSRLSNQDKYSIIKSLIEGVTCLHKKGIVHQDIDPNNILVTSTRPITVEITGFLLSRSKNLDWVSICRHADFCPPELLAGVANAVKELPFSKAKKHDIWSCGIVIYNIIQNHLHTFPHHVYYEPSGSPPYTILENPDFTRFLNENTNISKLFKLMLSFNEKSRASNMQSVLDFFNKNISVNDMSAISVNHDYLFNPT